MIFVVFSAPSARRHTLLLNYRIKLLVSCAPKVHAVAILPLYAQLSPAVCCTAGDVTLRAGRQAPCWRQWTVLADAPLGKGQSTVALPINAADGPNLAFVD